jgi:hypothetical protein
MAPRSARRIALFAAFAGGASALASCSSEDCRSVEQVTYAAALVDGEVTYVVHTEALQLPLAVAGTTSQACAASLAATTTGDAFSQLRLTLQCHEAIGADVSLDVLLPVDLRTVPADGSPHAIVLPRQAVRRATFDAATNPCFDGAADATASVGARDARGSILPFPDMVSSTWARTFELELQLGTPSTPAPPGGPGGPLCAGPENLRLHATFQDAKGRYATAVTSSCGR